MEFKNWAGNQICLPAERVEPRSSAEVASVVRRAADRGLTVKVVGAGHSFTDVACTNGILISLDHMNSVDLIDTSTSEITVGAGIRLHDLNENLDVAGLAMPNLGDIAYQSIAGAIATGTHGTGEAFGNLATMVTGMEIVTGSGEIVWCDADSRAELFSVARVGIGALGIVTRVRLRVAEAFNLAVRETIEPLDDLLDNFDSYVSEVDHFEFFWLPGARRAQVKRNTRTSDPIDAPTRVAYFRDKILAENMVFGLVNRVGRRFPRAVPTVAKVFPAGVSERSFVDRSDRVFASPRLVKFYEMEYGIPREALPEAFGRVREFTSRLGMPIRFPIECRVSAADDIALSTGEGRDSAWIACHVYQGTPYDAYFQGIEAIMAGYGGRPHWGKLHFRSAEDLAPLYPQWDRFAAVRDEVDPDRRFANSYLDRVLGI